MKWLVQLLQRIQSPAINSRDSYSIERFCACYQYAQSASSRRVFMVCVLTILPPLITIVLLDSFPLRDPSEGWKANWVFWIRQALSTIALSAGVILQFYVTAPAVALTLKPCVVISVVSAIIYTTCAMLIAAFVAFPIPFAFITTCIFWEVAFIACIIIATGWKKMFGDHEIRKQVNRFVRMMLAQLPLIFFYASYNAVFNHLRGVQQMALVILLPMAKFVFKLLLERAASDLDDYVPTLLISIDVFDAIYLSKCMQSSGSLMTTCGVMVIDTTENLYHLWRFQKLVDLTHDLQQQSGFKEVHSNLMSAVLEICSQPELLLTGELERLPVRSCVTFGRALSKGKLELIENLSQRQIKVKNTSRKSRLSFLSSRKAFPLRSIFPMPTIQMTQVATTTNVFGSLSIRRQTQTRTKLLKRSLDLLRMTEVMLLVEYIECAIPMLYATYLPIIFYLPTGKYYPEISALDVSMLRSTVFKIMLYAGLEFLSLIWVHWMLKRKFQVSGLRQLAFALEEEQLVVQASFLTWTIVIFQFTLQHLGKQP